MNALKRSTEVDAAALLSAELPALLGDVLGCSIVEIAQLTALSGGTSRDTWSIVALADDGTRHRVVLQRRRTLAVESGIDITTEAQLLRAAHKAGAPVPRLLAWEVSTERFGLPFLLLEHVDGETIPQRILRDAEFDRARLNLVGDYGRALAHLQRVPLEEVTGLHSEDPLEHYRRIYEDLDTPHPALELGFRWLADHHPRYADVVVVHGDYRNGNGIVGPGGLVAVIDLELAHLGDPLEDLGWFCIRAWRFGASPRAGGLGSIDDLVAGYQEVSGRTVDHEVLRWWIVLGTVRWAVICMMQGATQLSGHRRSIELAAVGRRVAEPEFDLMLLLP